VHSNWQIKALAEAQLSAPVDIYLKVNSGMNRLGFRPEQAQAAYKKLRALPGVGDITLMAHFADAENPDGLIEPLQRIERAAEGLDIPRSLSNSACTLWHPEAHYDWVRPGIILYGASPSGDWQDIASTGLKPVMTLNSEIIGLQQLSRGDGVGYGYRYHAQQEQRIRRLSTPCAQRHAGIRRWRDDAGDWRRLDGYDHRRLNALPSGRHRFEG